MVNARDPRAPRTTETREANSQDNPWIDASHLPTPEPQEGFVFRWVRTATLGVPDPRNVSTRFREGWIPVPKEETAHLGLMSDHKSRFPENLEVGGLLLCRMEAERAERRQKHYEQVSQTQLQASDHNFMKQSDPRMPVLEPERTTTTTFGSGRPSK